MSGQQILNGFGISVMALLAPLASSAAEKPNIVVILADDLGYGDVGCYNPATAPPINAMYSNGAIMDGEESRYPLINPIQAMTEHTPKTIPKTVSIAVRLRCV